MAAARRHAIPPRVIKTDKEAQKFTRNDPMGKTWVRGETYYLIDAITGKFACPDHQSLKAK